MKLSATKYGQLLLSLIEREKISDEMIAAFLTLLRKNRQEKLLPRILLAVEQQWKKSNSIQDMTLTISQKMDTEEIQKELEKSLGLKQIILHEKIDPESLGGARIEFNDHVYDFTVQSQLAELKNTLLSENALS